MLVGMIVFTVAFVKAAGTSFQSSHWSIVVPIGGIVYIVLSIWETKGRIRQLSNELGDF